LLEVAAGKRLCGMNEEPSQESGVRSQESGAGSQKTGVEPNARVPLV
jgi:hypothetical protein